MINDEESVQEWTIEYSNGSTKNFTGTFKEVLNFVYLEGDHVVDWGKSKNKD